MKSKQEKIFAGWFDKYKNLIFKIVRTYADSPDDQDDLFQDILLQLWLSIPAFEGNAKETTWIYRVALNTALVFRRGETRKRKRHRIKFLEITQQPNIKQDFSDPEQTEQIIDRLYDAIRRLSKTDGSLVLMHLEGLSYEQIGEVLGITINNVGVRLNRAKKSLAQLLKGLIDDF